MKNMRFRERGSAVILALALLSLMMILIMSFVTNALLDSRVAETKKQLHNVQNVSDIALNRALMSLKYFVTNPTLGGSWYPIDRFNKFVSWTADNNLPSPLNSNNPTNNDGYAEIHNTAAHSATETAALKRSYGGLKGAMDTKLFPNSDDIFLYRYPTNRYALDDANETWVANAGRSFIEQPRWVYLQDDNNNDIGRFAYAVLPDKGQVNAAMIMNSPPTLPERKGKSIDFDITNLLNNEYDFFKSTPTDFESINGLKLSQKSGATVIDDQLRAITDSSKLIDVAMFVGELADIEFDDDDDDDNKNKDINALYQKMTFNLAGYPSDKQSADGTDRINLNNQTFWNGTDIDGIKTAIPYLGNIGIATNNFVGTDPAATFRNQVTANMKDFLDENDDITSDVDAGAWDLDNAPAYTGNEKTALISGMAFFVEAKPNAANNKSVDFTLHPEFEVMNLYNNSTLGADQYAVNWKINQSLLKMRINAKIKVKVTIKLQLDEEIIDIPYEASYDSDDPDFIPSGYKTFFAEKDVNFAEASGNTEAGTAWADKTYSKNSEDKTIKTVCVKPASANYIAATAAIDYTDEIKDFIANNKDKFTVTGSEIADQSNSIDPSLKNAFNNIVNEFRDKNLKDSPNVTFTFDENSGTIESINNIEIVTGSNVNAGNCILVGNSANIDYVKGKNWNDIAHVNEANAIGGLDGNTMHACILRLYADPRANLNAADWQESDDGKTSMLSLETAPITSEENYYNMLNSMEYLGIVERFNNPNVSNTPIKFSTLAGISRGEAWKTLNIIKASTANNPTFADGDAKILDKLDIETADNDPLSDSFYKVNANTASPDIWKGLLTDLKFYDAIAIGGKSSNPDEAIFDGTFDEDHLILGNGGITGIVGNLVSNKDDTAWQLRNRGDVLRVITETWNELYSSDKLYGDDNNISIENLDNDQKKRLFGLVDNLIPIVKVEKFPEEFQILIVAQSLNPNSLAADVVDKITAEEKILVTVRRDGNNFTIVKKEKMLY